jgi:integrase
MGVTKRSGGDRPVSVPFRCAPGGVLRRVEVSLEKVKLPISVRLYDLRHTAATLLLTAGLPVNVVPKRLGRDGPGITLDRYVEQVPNMQAQAADRMERLLSEHR